MSYVSDKAIQKIRATRKAEVVRSYIAQVLLGEWDPIGIQDHPQCDDEYDNYIGGVFQLLRSGATADEIIDHLLDIERTYMGLRGQTRSRMAYLVEKLQGFYQDYVGA